MAILTTKFGLVSVFAFSILMSLNVMYANSDSDKVSLVRVGSEPSEVYKSTPEQSDLRLVHLDAELLDKLREENQVLVDLSGLIRPEKERGFFVADAVGSKMNLFVKSILETIEFKNKAYPTITVIGQNYTLRFSVQYLDSDGAERYTIKPGDIIIVRGD
ncbi:MAG: hypothetical protein AAF546_02490 [Verrucomicrobiota bacterium]